MDIFLFNQLQVNLGWSNHQAHPTPGSTCRVRSIWKPWRHKTNISYTNDAFHHVSNGVHWLEVGWWIHIPQTPTCFISFASCASWRLPRYFEDENLGVHVARMSARPTPELPRPGSLMWSWRQMICIYLIIYTSGHLYSWYIIRGMYNVFMVYRYLSWLRSF